MTAPQTSLARLVRQQNWTALEEQWSEHSLGSAELAPALEAIKVAAHRREIARVVPFVREQAKALMEKKRHEEACELLGHAMLQGGSPGDLGPLIVASAQSAFGSEPGWETFQRLADLREGAPDLRNSWRTFAKLRSLGPGRVVYHAKGWGLGSIESIELASEEVRVTFASGKRDRFPLQTALDIFEVLEPDDLRSLVVTDPKALTKHLNSEPLEVLRWICKRNDGRVNHAGMKLALATLGVEGPKFTAWWRKARKSAETSEWFELSGPPTRVTVRLLDIAEDPAEGLKRQLRRASGLDQALARVKALVDSSLEDEVREAALETLEGLAADKDQPFSDRLATWLFLRDLRAASPPALRDTFLAAAGKAAPSDPSVPPPLWELLQRVPGAREQEKSFELMDELLGREPWLDEVAKYLPHAPSGMVRSILDALTEAERMDVLVGHYRALLARPTRNPSVLVRLADRIEKGAAGDEELPSPVQRVQCLLQLAVFLHKNAPGNVELSRARQRLTTLFASGKPPVLRRLLDGVDNETLRGLATMVEGNLDGPLDRLFTRIAVDTSPEIFRGDDRPYWDTGSIWTTRQGLADKERELRHLRDVLIPENAEAIGRAAAYGDLSENSEWEAAIEEQRKLTSRAMELEQLVRDAQLLENAAIPEETVAPGTRVTYRELASGKEKTITILGPWEADGASVVSYRSPLAEGMLGKHPGERETVTLPSGTLDIEVLAVAPYAFP